MIKGTWTNYLNPEMQKQYFANLLNFIDKERTSHTIFPKKEDVFKAFELTPFEDVKVVLIGQDPYHNPNQAHGLSFSVNSGVKIPPSLNNIFKELKTDLGIQIPTHGNLSFWAKQGVLLLNATLTVRANEPGSHQNKGWEQFTDFVIQTISKEKNHCVFLLWGNYAKNKKVIINSSKHLILEAAHPSPLARGGFFECKHFSKTNEYLKSHNQQAINWNISTENLLF